jgi:plastocyanin
MKSDRHERRHPATGRPRLVHPVVGVLAVAALGLLTAACSNGTKAAAAGTAPPAVQTTAPPVVVTQPPPVQFSLVINPEPLGGIKNGAGDVVDAIVPGNIKVQAGSSVTMTFTNYDTAAHDWKIRSLGIDIKVPGATKKGPGVKTSTFTAPQAGKYIWHCAIPCDHWAMTHLGYMEGTLTVEA